MQKKSKTKIVLICAVFLFITNCGRKQKIFSNFEKEQENINKLDLPAVKGLTAQKNDLGVHISWLPLFSEKTLSQVNRFQNNLLGFNIFRLENNAMFIPKTPINKHVITVNYYIDTSNKNITNASYTIQPIFKFENKIISGPSSQIIKITK